MATDSSFTALPDDVLQRVLLGVALDDHDATAAACRAFRDVIRKCTIIEECHCTPRLAPLVPRLEQWCQNTLLVRYLRPHAVEAAAICKKVSAG